MTPLAVAEAFLYQKLKDLSEVVYTGLYLSPDSYKSPCISINLVRTSDITVIQPNRLMTYVEMRVCARGTGNSFKQVDELAETIYQTLQGVVGEVVSVDGTEVGMINSCIQLSAYSDKIVANNTTYLTRGGIYKLMIVA